MALLSRLGPLRASMAAAVVEAAAGYIFLLMLGGAINGFRRQAGPSSAEFFVALGWLCLFLWPAWRLRVVQGRSWWIRVARGVGRALLIVALLTAAVILFGLAAAAISAWPWAGFHLPRWPTTSVFSAFAFFVCGFFVMRTAVLAGAWVVGTMERRLRWQLMASHVAVIVLILTAMTAAGSVAASQLLVWGTQPDTPQMASSVVELLQLFGSPTSGASRDGSALQGAPGVHPSGRAAALTSLDDQRARTLFQEIENGRLTLRGQPPLVSLVHNPILPTYIVLMDLDGTVRVTANNRDARQVALSWPAIRAEPSIWPRLRSHARAGQAFSLQTNVPITASGNRELTPMQLGEAPIQIGHRPAAMVVVATTQVIPGANRIVQYTVAIFGLATILLILAMSLPVLALSFLFSYLLARSLTRRLESVSRVATAIASGNLAQRAPINARNEIGGLAGDINRMAAHLETTMGELRRARAQAVEALRLRQELVANISHELRTPLAVVRAHLETVMMEKSAVPAAPASAREAAPDDEDVTLPAATLRALQVETERLEGLVDDLFALSRAEAGALEVRLESVDVAALVDEVAAVMRPLAQRHGMIALTVEAQPGLPHAMADAERLRQIIANLVRNAVRHTPDGGIIVLGVAKDGSGEVVISVADTGEGIPREHLPHIFERFYRVDQARTHSEGGAGLGLAIVREFVELMGGRVTVESTPGEGTCFRVFLPTA